MAPVRRQLRNLVIQARQRCLKNGCVRCRAQRLQGFKPLLSEVRARVVEVLKETAVLHLTFQDPRREHHLESGGHLRGDVVVLCGVCAQVLDSRIDDRLFHLAVTSHADYFSVMRLDRLSFIVVPF